MCDSPSIRDNSTDIAPLLEAVRRAKEPECTEAFRILLSRYKPLLLSFVYRFLPYGQYGGLNVDKEDLTEEATIALYRAVLTYRADCGVTFGLYAKQCMRNGMLSYLRCLNSQRRQKEADDALLNLFPVSDSSPEERLVDSARSQEWMTVFFSTLTPLERSVFDYRLNGVSYLDIAHHLSVSEKSVDNAMCRVKKKLIHALRQAE